MNSKIDSGKNDEISQLSQNDTEHILDILDILTDILNFEINQDLVQAVI